MITKKDIADALGLTVQRLDDIFGTGNRAEINRKVCIIATESLASARAQSESSLLESRQAISDLQGKLESRFAVHEAAFAKLQKIIDDSKENKFSDESFPDIDSILREIE